MQLPKDLASGTYRSPDVILCQVDKEKICKLNVVNLNGTFKFNAYSEITFDVPAVYTDMISGETKPTPYYDYIEALRLVYLEGFGYFQIQDPQTYGDGIQEYKTITAYSLEYSLSQKYLELFTINKGAVGDTIESIDEVKLYNPTDPSHSLLHLALEKTYGMWTIGSVDPELRDLYRYFQIDRQSIYDFLVNDVAEEFRCYFEFDTINNEINVFSEEEEEVFYGDGKTKEFQLSKPLTSTSEITINSHPIKTVGYNEETKKIIFENAPAPKDIIIVADEFKSKYDTDVIVAFENLSNEMTVNYSADDIKTVLSVKGVDDLGIEEVNFGSSTIMNLDYYYTPEWMGQTLYNEYTNYLDKQEKYMDGFYTKDISGATEVSIDVITTKEEFTAGSTETNKISEEDKTLVVENLVADSFTEILNVEHTSEEPDIEYFIDQHEIIKKEQYFTEPSLNVYEFNWINPDIKNIPVSEYIVSKTIEEEIEDQTIFLPEDFRFNSNTIVKINNEETINYIYNQNNHSITYNEKLVIGDTISIITSKNQFLLEKDIVETTEIFVDEVMLPVESYEYNQETKTLIVNIPLSIGKNISIYTYVQTYNLEEEINNDSIIYLDEVQLYQDDYSFSNVNSELTIYKKLTENNKIKIETPTGEIINSFILEYPNYKITSVTINGVITNNYSLNSNKTILTINDSLIYEDVIVIKFVDNHFTLNEVKDKITSVKIDNIEVNYEINNNIITINDNQLSMGVNVYVESIDTHFTLKNYKGNIAAVYIDDIEIYNYDFNNETMLLTIFKDNLSSNSIIKIEYVNNVFQLLQSKDILTSVYTNDNIEIHDYNFNKNTKTLIVPAKQLVSVENIAVDSVNNNLPLTNPKDKISIVRIDGKTLSQNDFVFNGESLIINSSLLEAYSRIHVESIQTHFEIFSDGEIQEVLIDSIPTTNYVKNNNIIIINDNRLKSNSDITINFLSNQFQLSKICEGKVYVFINNTNTTNYHIDSKNKILTITDPLLKSGDSVVVEFVNNIFEVPEELGNRYSIILISGGIEKHLYKYNGDFTYSDKKITINVPLRHGDKIIIQIIGSDTNVLEIVLSNAKEGQILLSNVKPVLNNYTPTVGDFVIKKTGYTELISKQYQLIEDRTKELYAVAPDLAIHEIIFDSNGNIESGEPQPEASLENLGEIYKKVTKDSDGNIFSTTYEVCKMKYKVVTDENNKEKNVYTYEYEKTNLELKDSGLYLLKEKEQVYAMLNELQAAAGWHSNNIDALDEEENMNTRICSLCHHSGLVRKDTVFQGVPYQYECQTENCSPSGWNGRRTAYTEEQYEKLDRLCHYMYKQNLENLQKVRDEIAKKEEKIEEITNDIDNVVEQLREIANDINPSTNFSPISLERLSMFMREDEFTDDCINVTSIDSDMDKINRKKELLVSAQKELKKISRPKLSFTASMKNIYAMPEFAPILNQFKLGNFIKVKMRTGFLKKARLLEVQFDFNDLSNFSCTFGDLLSAKDQGDIHADLLKQAVSAGKAVANGSSNWQKGYDMATYIDNKIKQGLIDATTTIKSNSAGQQLSWDTYGIHLQKVVDGKLDRREGWITNNMFLYSDDNFKTTRSVFGNYTITTNQLNESGEYVKESVWGLLAEAVIAGYIEGSRIEGGTIHIGWNPDTKSYAFEVDEDGTVTMSKGDAEKLSYFNFDPEVGLIIGDNLSGTYFTRATSTSFDVCRRAKIATVKSNIPNPNIKINGETPDYCRCEYKDEKDILHYDYYKLSDCIKLSDGTWDYGKPYTKDKVDYEDPEIRFGIEITTFTKDTTKMIDVEIENNLKVGTDKTNKNPSISLGIFKLTIEDNGSMSILSEI